jgi:hypothetical protein
LTNTIEFNDSNWSTPVTVILSGHDDAIAENRATERITHTISSSGGTFTGATDDAEIEVDLRDNDAGGLVVVQSGDSTIVSESTPDTYAIMLSKAPTAPVTVSILTDGQTVASADSASDGRLTVGADGVPKVTFDGTNWNVPFVVRLAVGDNAGGDGGQPVQTYPAQPHVVSGQIEGPLVIEGSFIPGKDRSLKIAVTLPTERI